VIRSGGSEAPDSGDIVFRAAKPKGQQVVPRKVADQVTDAMEGVIDHGTATRARQDFPVYGKTGTTNDYTNAWFVGCTRTLCIATWMGYDKLKPMRHVEGVRSVVGGSLPAEIFSKSWQNWDAIKEAEKHPGAVISPTPKRSSHPRTSRTPTPLPSVVPTKTAAPKPTPPSSPKPKPTCTGLLCNPNPP
jgi:membrane peptidoglycan carboxypeptidase